MGVGVIYSEALHCGNALLKQRSIQYDMTDLEGFRKVLNSLNKEDLEDVLADSYIPSSGKKEKVVENILKNSTFLERIIKKTVRESYKDDLIEMCEHLGIESDGSTSEIPSLIVLLQILISSYKIELLSGINCTAVLGRFSCRYIEAESPVSTDKEKSEPCPS